MFQKSCLTFIIGIANYSHHKKHTNIILTPLNPTFICIWHEMIINRNGRKRTLGQCARSEDSDQTAHSRSLIRIFTGRFLDSRGYKVSSGEQRGLWSDCADAQVDLSLAWARMSEMYVAIYYYNVNNYCCSNSKTGVYRGIHYFSYFCSKHRLWAYIR